MNPIITVGVVAFNDKGQVLLVREEEGSAHLTGMHGLPAGRVEESESKVAAAAREFHEETGLDVDLQDVVEYPGNFFIADIPRKDGTVKTFHHTTFLIKKFSGDLSSGPETTAIWTSIKDVKKLEEEKKLLPNVLAAIDAAMEGNHT